jgi:two-component system chemotaxis sensor kinase CheA
MDFSVFDSILDLIFVIDGDGKVVYCNETAATFCQTSVRRVAGKAKLSDIILFAEPNLLPFTAASQGREAPTPFIETDYNLVKGEKAGKVQLAVRPIDGTHWGVFIKDVSLEETLAKKYRGELAKTEEYARNLEKLVEARTGELRAVNQTLNAILNSLGQGFFTFDAQGVCGGVYTKACEDVLEGVPKDRKAWEELGVPEKEVGQFRKWMETSFQELLPFDDLKGLGPSLFPHSQGKHVVLDYFPIRREGGAISDIVVVATDKTAEHRAQQALEAERQYASMVVKFLKNKDQFMQFLASVRTSVATLKALAAKPLTAEAVNESFRILHTLEGEAGTFSLRDLRQSARDGQHILEPFKGQDGVAASAQENYLRSLDALLSGFEKFLAENDNIFRLPKGEVERLVELPLESVTTFLRELKGGTPRETLVRRYSELFVKVPIEARLKYFDSLTQSVAERLGKKVKPMVIEGGDLRIFPGPYQGFFSALVHAFRNAIDHGLEMPEEREWAGKDPAGTIRVSVAQVRGGLTMRISDDGKGIDPAIIREKLKSKFPDRDFSRQNDDEIIQNVCLPGFSSRDSVGEFSGRGVGLDALREEVVSLGGSVHLKSKVGEGTAIEIFIPEAENEESLIRSA